MMLANPRAQIEWYAREMIARQVSPEYEIYNITMLEELERLIDRGLAPPAAQRRTRSSVPLRRAEHEGHGRTSPTWCDRSPAGANIDVIAIGRAQLPLTTIGLAMGAQRPRRAGGQRPVQPHGARQGQRASRGAHRPHRPRTSARAGDAGAGPRTPRNARPYACGGPGARRRSGEAGLPGAGRVRGRSARRMRGPGRV